MPGYRGRLIFPFQASIRRLDTLTTSEDPDGAGALESGYDPDFREPVQVPSTAQAGTSARAEMTATLIPVQVEPTAFESLRLMLSGATPDVSFQVVAHFRDLERLGLVHATSKLPLIKMGDRLEAIYENDGITLAQEMPTALFLTDIRPMGFGFSTSRNLLLLTFQEREQSALR